jgi:hypothetical protein
MMSSWYFAIAAGFLLLAIHRLLAGEGWGPTALRFLIAAGFAALGYGERRGRRK